MFVAMDAAEAVVVSKNEIVTISNTEMDVLSLSSDDDYEGSKGPVRLKNEMADLPPVPPVNVVLGPHHQTLAIGVVSSIMGSQVIVDGQVKHTPLNEGSILWITETRSPLGVVDEIFGPVKNPYYIVRYNSASEVPDGIHEGIAVSFVAEFCNLILNQNDLFKKGYDASGENDEEVANEIEFSDDEKEAEYKRSLKASSKMGQKDAGHDRSVKVPLKAMEKHRNSNQEPFFERNQFKGTGGQKDLHKPCPLASGMGKLASFPPHGQFPSISGGSQTECSFDRSVQSFGNKPPTVPAIPQVVQPEGLFGMQRPIFLQQAPSPVWIPQMSMQQQNRGPMLPVQQKNYGLIGGLVQNTPFQLQQQMRPQFHCMQPQLQQHQLVPGFCNTLPFQQHIPSNQGLQFDFGSVTGQLNSSGCPVPMGVPTFGQPPFVNKNVDGALGVAAINRNTNLYGQPSSATTPGNVHPPMQFTMGSTNPSGSFRPSNTSHFYQNNKNH